MTKIQRAARSKYWPIHKARWRNGNPKPEYVEAFVIKSQQHTRENRQAEIYKKKNQWIFPIIIQYPEMHTYCNIVVQIFNSVLSNFLFLRKRSKLANALNSTDYYFFILNFTRNLSCAHSEFIFERVSRHSRLIVVWQNRSIKLSA